MNTFTSEYNPLLKSGIQNTLNITNAVTSAGQTLKSNIDGSFSVVTDTVPDSTEKGIITVNTDFPLIAEVEFGWWYSIASNVTDNAGVLYSNTGKSFLAGDTIYWTGTTWDYFKRDTLTYNKTFIGDVNNLAKETGLTDYATPPNTNYSLPVESVEGNFLKGNIGTNFGGTAASNIQSLTTTQVSQIIQALIGQTVALQQLKDENGNNLFEVSINGTITTALRPSALSFLTVSSSGVVNYDGTLVIGKLSDAAAINAITNTGNWDINGAYTGAISGAITNTHEGQYYRDADYYYFAYSDNDWTRLPRV